MSKEAIRQIKETEAQAEQIRLDAAAQARKMIAEAEAQADELRSNVKDDAQKALASDLSAYVTGQVISCCGGMNC